MINTIHDVSFSFEQPEVVLNSLLKLIQQRLRLPLVSPNSREVAVRNAFTIVIIDTLQQRARYIANLLTAVGYRSVLVPHTLDAYTLFLQGDCLPLAVVLGQEDSSQRLFLGRLVQQMQQRYDWDLLLMRLQSNQQRPMMEMQPPTLSGPAQTHTSFANLPSFPGIDAQPPRPSRPAAPSSGTSTSWGSVNAAPPQQWSGPVSPGMGSRTGIQPPLAASAVSWQGLGENAAHPPSVAPGAGAFAQPPIHPQMRQPATNDLSMSNVGQQPTGPHSVAQPAPGYETALPPQYDHGGMKKEKISLDGQSIGRYQINKRLGGSPYSDVYQTYDRLREQENALKAVQIDFVPYYMMNESQEDISVFQLESELLSKLPHPHILPILNTGKSYVSGSQFIYKNMPYCEQGALQGWIQRYGEPGSFTYRDVLHVVSQIADALQYAHNHHIIYQNFKLSNVLVLNNEKKMHKIEVAISDFAIVQNGSFFPSTVDALYYVAPERWEGVSMPVSDQYALAAMTYELLTGRPPFQGASERVLRILHTTKLAQPPTSLNPRLPKAVNGVLLRALSKNPNERFGSVALFMQALLQC
ncbi:MAG TPA: protein kinase [Dictyobacter sp.]|jgi:hypothetical protein|nr:protein kinase [Dictyobacter sp.]